MTESTHSDDFTSAIPMRPDLPSANQVAAVSSSDKAPTPRKESRRRKAIDVHPLIRQIIDRDCHVGSSNKEVIRHVISKLKHGLQTFRNMPAMDREQLIEQCLVQHKGNLELYLDVMVGTHRQPMESVQATLPPSELSGRELIRLMRQHRVTIASLAFRIGVTQKRIRQLRETGILDPKVVRDWIEAITGKDPGPVPERYRINGVREEAECCFCGYPLYNSDEAWELQNEVFCSLNCCQKSRR